MELKIIAAVWRESLTSVWNWLVPQDSGYPRVARVEDVRVVVACAGVSVQEDSYSPHGSYCKQIAKIRRFHTRLNLKVP